MARPFDPKPAAAAIAGDRLARRVIAALADDVRPADVAEGYQVQFAVHAAMAPARGARVGWKIGATTRVMQEWLAIDHPCGGGVLVAGVLPDGGRTAAGDYTKPMVETEIAARLAADLPPIPGGYNAASVASAVASIHPGIELVDDRYGDFARLGVPTLIADDFFQSGVVIGPAAPDWRALDLPALRGQVTIGGIHRGEGVGAAMMGHPLTALAWLADTLNAAGTMLRAGEFVFLGSVVAPQPVVAGDHVVVEFAGLGRVEVSFT
ncbi:2-oxo-3-hexenedioate decarboxylase/2-keto-4-pentenoate hydratase [Stella humosa]|uniref:2-oxo-3-hexenedioate decarboxylase/2-keto-4-pentenoate hydratase n=1 Tax=Stella humosa TaxID=94 RepID=A0A3N1M7F8_9PROT|nr:fumarylacetoacetate hydrolase family protein [Stella humosa]ROQ01762.1 2-oxo-3-hexenedioate decarboxylase/2-keto-4-pentenoate hydratase [Stella humosa]BBK32146.1 hydratase [Stella humosa]